jgi:hypothetical protein
VKRDFWDRLLQAVTMAMTGQRADLALAMKAELEALDPIMHLP